MVGGAYKTYYKVIFMTIRPYTKEDLKEIVKVINSVATEEHWPHYYPNGWDEERVRNEFRPMDG